VVCRFYPAAFLVVALAGCASTGTRLLLPADGSIRSIDQLVDAHPIPEGQNILPVLLGQTDTLSYHLIQIRDRESPHVHAHHDLVVTLLRGEGTLHLSGRAQPMRRGDVAVVPKRTPHFFVNTGARPAAAFVTFAPPYDGKDNVPID
jgi:mannose-6-phosphate isomerase-like protein (cupin superfamily)